MKLFLDVEDTGARVNFYIGQLGIGKKSLNLWVHYSLPRGPTNNPYIEFPLINARLTKGTKKNSIILRNGLSNIYLIRIPKKGKTKIDVPSAKRKFDFEDPLEVGCLVESDQLELEYHWSNEESRGTSIIKATGEEIELDFQWLSGNCNK